MVVCRLPYRGKPRKGGPQTPLRCAQNAAFCKPFASAAGSRPYRRKIGAPVGGASASAGANALSAKGGRFCLWTSPPAKVRKERLSQKDKSGAAGPERLRQGPAQTAAGRNGAFFCGRRRARPPQPVLSFLREKVRAGRLILRGPSYAQSKKTPDGRRGSPAGRKSAGKNAQGGSGCLSGTASAGRTRRTAETAASGGFSLAQHPPARRTGKADVFRPLAACQRRRILQTPARARFCPPSAKGESQRRQSPRRPPRRPEARPQTRAGRRSAPGGLPTGWEPRRYLRLAGGPLVLQQLQRTFFVLVFLYFDYACTQSPAHRAAEKTGRTIFS